jgi:hypothetical protein
MSTGSIRYFWFIVYWILGPWLSGIALVFAVSLVRSIVLAKYLDGQLHYHLTGTYLVISRTLTIILALIFAAAAAGLIVHLSKKANWFFK